MRRIVILLVCLGMGYSLSGLGDQLQWNDLETCERAAAEIRKAGVLISYCSLAEEPNAQFWLVRDVAIIPTTAEGLWEVIVTGRLLNAFTRRHFDEKRQRSSGNLHARTDTHCHWFVEGVDLAYIYVPIGNGDFTCLGRSLDQPCSVTVETIHVSGVSVNKTITKAGS